MRLMRRSICCIYALIVSFTMNPLAFSDALPVTPITLPQALSVPAGTDPVAQSIQALLVPLDTRIASSDPVIATTHRRIDVAQAVRDFYQQRGFAAVWTNDGDLSALLDGLAGVQADGLNSADFRLSELTASRAQMSAASPPAARARFDVSATTAYLMAVLQLRRGKVDPASLDKQWNFEPEGNDPREEVVGLFRALLSHEIANVFKTAPPQSPIYTRLRVALARLQQIHDSGGWPLIVTSSPLKVGMRNPAVTQLRDRLIAGGYLDAQATPSDAYDAAVVSAVKTYQTEQYLTSDGIVSSATLASLNVPIEARLDQVRVNLERARWLLYKLQGTFVVVDIAGFKVAMYRDGQPIWRSRVQVGKPFRSTPVFQSEITYVTFNPTWTVPPTILKNDVLPQILKNPNYLAEHRMRVLDRAGQVIDASTVDWHKPNNVVLRQDAGPDNSLGQVVIRFPNAYAVYLHDTPHRDLFSRERRATSSGCIRVDNPLKLVELLFNDPQHWDAAGIQAQLAKGTTTNIPLPMKIPVLLAYWTVDLQEDGRVSFKSDVYGHDQVLLRALNQPY